VISEGRRRHSGLLIRSSSGLLELRFLINVKVRVRLSCKVSASLIISQKPGMADPWNGSSTKTIDRGLDKLTSRETGPDIRQSFPYDGR